MTCALGFDVGTRIIGVAVGNTITRSARALAIAPVRDGNIAWDVIDNLHKTWLPDTLVVGLPLTLDGGEQPASRGARRFGARLRERYGVPVVFVDERHSSQEAARRFASARAAGLKRRHHADDIDAEAAAVILEHWLLEPPGPLPHVPAEPAQVDPTP
jgi:putative Holliday junction resolvase